MTENPREYTPEEVRDQLLEHLRQLVLYWEGESRAPTARAKLEGLAFSICSALDGCSLGLPGFRVLCSPSPSDKAFLRDRGENWYPEGADLGMLHEHFHKARQR